MGVWCVSGMMKKRSEDEQAREECMQCVQQTKKKTQNECETK